MEENSLTPGLRNKVFENELIRDQIFNYVFSSDVTGNILPIKNVLTCRLVEQSWLKYVTFRLQNSASPEYTIDFKFWQKSKKTQNFMPRKYQVKKFVDTWTNFPSAGSRIPLFNLEYSISTRKKGMVRDFVKCLMHCGNGLCRLRLKLCHTFFIDDYDTATLKLHLPNLKSLRVLLPSRVKVNDEADTQLLHHILLSCKRLTYFSLRSESFSQVALNRLLSGESLPNETEQLPSSLECIELDVNMTAQLMENLLLGNDLPNLKELWLCSELMTDNSVISRILNRFRLQLRFFSLQGHLQIEENNQRENLSLTFIKFPLMTKLKGMSICSCHSEPASAIKQYFPVLENLKLYNQTVSMLQMWTQNCSFKCLKSLTFELSGRIVKDGIFTTDLSQQLHASFPVVKKLDLTFEGYVDGAIQNIFQNMTQLSKLSIRLRNTQGIMGSSTWNAILLGVTPQYAKFLAETPQELWDSINLNNHQTPLRSIVNLSSLTTFLLDGPSDHATNERLISEISFWFAFLRMPKLDRLILNGRFKASKQMEREWCQLGRKIYGH